MSDLGPVVLVRGRVRILALERRVEVDGRPVALGARAFDLLLELASRPGELRTRHELLEAVWPGVVVEDGNLATQVSTLRRLLGGDLIATVPGRGYCFTGLPADPADVPAAPAAASAASAKLRTNLPSWLPPLIGRDDDLATLDRLVADRALVSVVGAGGIGKTRLVQAYLHARRDAFPHGVCLVDLSPVADAQAVVPAVAAALGLTLGQGDPTETLCALCAPLHMLVALDNAEHLLDATAAVADALLAAAPHLRLVATSQAPLRLARETVFRLDALAVPDGPLGAHEALAHGAVALFAERARQADARFVLTDEAAPAVIALCRQLDGLPLAIELAAARVPLLGVRRLAASMDDRLRLLGGGHDRSAPARQHTLQAALAWSHGFLDAPARTVFRRLAVFVGSASLDLVRQVVADPDGDLDAWAVLDALTVLVDRSLVAVVPGDDAGAPRYRLLDSPRAFARERLAEAGELDLLRRRHVQALAAFCDAEAQALYRADTRRQAWLAGFARDADNARAAMAHAIDTGDRVAALRIGVALVRFADDLPAVQRLALADACMALLDDSVPAPLQVLAGVHLSRLLSDLRPARSLELAREAVARRPGLDDGPEGRFLAYLAWCALANAQARGTGRTPSLQAALDEARALEDPGWPPQRRRWRAQAAYQAAERASPEALGLARELLTLDLASGGDGFRIRAALIDAELAAGDPAAAARTGEALIADLTGGRNESALAYARLNLAGTWLSLGRPDAARRLAVGGWPQGRRFDMQPYWADYLALLAALEGRPEAAARLAGFADAAYAAHEDQREPNEAAARDRAGDLARAALGEAGFERLRAEGAALDEDRVAGLAFGTGDAS